MKQFAIALTCGLALALIAALLPMVIMQRQRNLAAQQNQQRIEARRLGWEQPWALEQQRVDARRLAEQQQQPTLEQRVLQHQQRLEARRLEEQRQQLALEQQRLDEAGRLEQRTVPHTYTYSVGPPRLAEQRRVLEPQQRRIALSCTGTLTTGNVVSGKLETPATLVIDFEAGLVSGALGQYSIIRRTDAIVGIDGDSRTDMVTFEFAKGKIEDGQIAVNPYSGRVTVWKTVHGIGDRRKSWELSCKSVKPVRWWDLLNRRMPSYPVNPEPGVSSPVILLRSGP